MREAREATNPRDVARLAAMASSLEHAARDLCFEADVDPNGASPVVSPEVDRERRAADERLTASSAPGDPADARVTHLQAVPREEKP
jgi:hypothetical protein